MKGLLLAFCILSLATMGSAAHLSMNQMAMIWKQNNGMDCQTAVAIGWATSMGDTKGRTPSSQGGMDRGLWGINSMRSHKYRGVVRSTPATVRQLPLHNP